MNEITKKISLFVFTFASVFIFCFNSAFAFTPLNMIICSPDVSSLTTYLYLFQIDFSGRYLYGYTSQANYDANGDWDYTGNEQGCPLSIVSSSGGGGGGGVLFGRHYGTNGDAPASTTSGLLAAVGVVSTDVFGGVWPYLMLSMGVFITFYIIQHIAMTMNMEKGKKKK